VCDNHYLCGYENRSSLGLLLVGYERHGSEEALAKNAIMHLFDVYVAVNADLEKEKAAGLVPQPTDQKAKEIFRLMEDGVSGQWRLYSPG
jgi:arginyl-tRNA synthetase